MSFICRCVKMKILIQRQVLFKLSKMKTFRIILFIAIAVIVTSCSAIVPQGAFTKQVHTYGEELNSISVGNGFDVKFDSSIPVGTIEIHTYENIHEYVKVEQKNGQLSISLNPNIFIDATMQAVISPAQFKEFIASGGSEMMCTELLDRNTLTVQASGGSEIEFNNVKAVDCNVQLSGGSDADLVGTTDNLEINASGGSDFGTIELACNSVKIVASGGSDIEVTVYNTITANLSGGSNLYYGGTPQNVNVNASGSSEYKQIQ